MLIKDNHIVAAGGVATAVQRAREGAPHTVTVEVECTTLEEVEEALGAGADVILLDNMTPEQLAAAVRVIADAPWSRPRAASPWRRSAPWRSRAST